MRLRSCALACGLCLLGAAPAAATVTFGAAVFGPVSGPPFAAAGLASLAPVARAWALTMTRAVDAASPRFTGAVTDGRHFRTLRLAWSVAGGVETACLDDVAVTSYAKLPATAGPARERITLSYAATARALGTGACRSRPPPPPVFALLSTDAGGRLHAELDCLLSRCTGTARLYCASAGCPSAGIALGALKPGPGESTLVSVPGVRGVRGRHPKLTVVIRLAGRRRALVARVVVDPPAPPAFAALTAAAPTSSGNPTPAGGGLELGGTPTGSGAAPTPTPTPTPTPSGGGDGTTPTPTPTPGPGSGSGDPLDTTLSLSCDGASGGTFRAVHGALGPNLAGQPIELDYVPVDPNADTVIDHVTTGAGGRFSDVPGAPFVEVIAFFGGDDSYVSSSAFCPASS